MDRTTTDHTNSIIKNIDVLTTNAAPLSSVAQIADGADELSVLVDKITTNAGIGSQDLSGYAEDKQLKREATMVLQQKCSRGGAAYYRSINDLGKLRKVDFTPTELQRQRDTDFYVTVKNTYHLLLPDAAHLIGVSPAQLTALNVANETFFLALEEPKNQLEKSKVANDSLPGLIKEAMDVRETIDIYMQTFADTEPEIFAQWRLSLRIDNTGGNNPPVLEIAMDLPMHGEIITIDYNGVTMQGNSEIKIKNTGNSVVEYGFGSTPDTFVGLPKTVGIGASERYTAASLHYNGAQARFLNARIVAPAQIDNPILVSFYDMD